MAAAGRDVRFASDAGHRHHPQAAPLKRRGGGSSALLALVLLTGCHKSFDERYADAQKKMREQAASIDQELAQRASEAATGEETASPATVASGAEAASPRL